MHFYGKDGSSASQRMGEWMDNCPLIVDNAQKSSLIFYMVCISCSNFSISCNNPHKTQKCGKISVKEIVRHIGTDMGGIKGI